MAYLLRLSCYLLVMIIALPSYSFERLQAPVPSLNATPAPLVKRSVFIHKHNGELIKRSLEMADTPESAEAGLMFRRELEADGGMVFNFSNCSHHAMWMKNTYIPLDMIFVGCDGTITHIISNVTPLSEKIITPQEKSAAVIELHAGESAKLGLAVGDKVEIQQRIMP